MKTINVTICKACFHQDRMIGLTVERRPGQTIAQTLQLLQQQQQAVSVSTLYRLFRKSSGLSYQIVSGDSVTEITLTTHWHELLNYGGGHPVINRLGFRHWPRMASAA